MKTLSKIAEYLILFLFSLVGLAIVLFVLAYTIGFSIAYFKNW
jgi:hypothetical protein